MTAVSVGMEANGISLPILGALLDAGVDVNAQDAEGNTALTLGVGECPTEVLRLLLARGADPSLGNPLIHALWHDGTGWGTCRPSLRPGPVHSSSKVMA